MNRSNLSGMKIIMLPGLDGTGKFFSEIEELLEPVHSPVVMEYPTDLYRYEDLRSWVEDRLPEGDFVIFAESFSGPLAAMIASREPAGLKGVVFVATFARTPVTLPAWMTAAARVLPIGSRPLAWLAQPLVMGKWASRRFTERFSTVIKQVPAATIAGRLREILKVDVREKLSHLAVPIMYLRASHDRLVPSRMSLDFMIAPDVVQTIEGPHFLLQANAPEAARRISAFAGHCSVRHFS